MKYLTLTLLIFITACTSLRDIQQSCEKPDTAFGDLVSCLQTNIENQNYKLDSFEHEYVLTAQKLKEDLETDHISETKARLELEHVYNQILIDRARLQAVQSSRIPNQINCRVINDRNITCRQF